jgi:micrococcal nuclease
MLYPANVPLPVPIVSVQSIVAKAPPKVFSEPVPIKLIKVLDGDTIRVLMNDRITKIRFACVDAPELDQEMGSLAATVLGDFLQQQKLTVVISGTDLYGRTIGSVYINGQAVSPMMVRVGLSFYYTQFKRCPELLDIVESENKARADRLGVWSISDYLPPWDWRKFRKQLPSSLAQP